VTGVWDCALAVAAGKLEGVLRELVVGFISGCIPRNFRIPVVVIPILLEEE
jgi:hypothetical protein